jgi:hypothetical protein
MGLPPADWREDADPVVMGKYPVFPLIVMVDHGQKAYGRVYCQNPAQFSNGGSLRNFKDELPLPERRKFGVIAF